MDSITLEKKVMSANEWGLMALLHEGLIKDFKDAIISINENNIEELNKVTNNARDILTELLINFRNKDELSTNLRSLYLFLNQMITEGEIKMDSAVFSKAIDVVNPIYLGFKGLEMKEDPSILSGLTYGKKTLEEYSKQESRTFTV